MNWLAVALAAVHGIQIIFGDKASGATKKQMATDVLTGVANDILPGLTGSNQAYGQAANVIAGLAIDQAVNIAKAAGTYQKATAIATAAQQDVGVAAAVADLVKRVQTPAPSTP